MAADFSDKQQELNNLINDSSKKDILKEMKKRLLAKMDKHGDNNQDVTDLRSGIEK
jgi:hypothetical protein